MPLTQKQMIEELWAKSQIERVMTDLGRALDQQDWALYRQCLADTIDVDFERTLGFKEIRIDADTWVELVRNLIGHVRTHHSFSNYAIDLDGDQARANIQLVARHWRSTDYGASEFNQYGWYENRFVREEGKWKLRRLLHTHRWTSGNGALFGNPTEETAALLGRVFCETNLIPCDE